MKIAVVGGRKFSNYALMKRTLDLEQPTMIISGGADGADTMAYNYARSRGVPFVAHPPLQEEKRSMGFARAAYRRNTRIVAMSEKVIAFPDPNSKGTWHAVKLAKRMGIPVEVIQE